jgi:hypothetical protein
VLYASPTPENNRTDLTTTKKQKTNDSGNNKDSLFLGEGPIVLSDLLALAIAMQLLGLTNVLNDPTFWNQGGWLQPITSTGISNTLPVVVQRFCTVAISWLSAAFAGKGLVSGATLPEVGKLLVPFFAVLLLLEATVSTTTSTGGGLPLFAEDVVWQTFQLWYFSAIALMAGRYIVNRLPFLY